jgi:hypothetical protein
MPQPFHPGRIHLTLPPILIKPPRLLIPLYKHRRTRRPNPCPPGIPRRRRQRPHQPRYPPRPRQNLQPPTHHPPAPPPRPPITPPPAASVGWVSVALPLTYPCGLTTRGPYNPRNPSTSRATSPAAGTGNANPAARIPANTSCSLALGPISRAASRAEISPAEYRRKTLKCRASAASLARPASGSPPPPTS